MGHYRSEMVDVDAEDQERGAARKKREEAIRKRIEEVGVAVTLAEIMEYNRGRIYLPWAW